MNKFRLVLLSSTIITLYFLSVLYGAELLLVPPSKLKIRRDTTPLTFTIEMPDYHHGTADEWIDGSRVLYQNLEAIAHESIYNVADPRLPIGQRLRALTIVEQFNPRITVDKLLVIIELEDQRGFVSGDGLRGRYPIVTVLKNYGQPVSGNVVAALAEEGDETRRELLCDVLQHVLSGPNVAIERLREYAKGTAVTPVQIPNLQAAIELLQQTDRTK